MTSGDARSRQQNAPADEFESCAAEHLALEHVDPADRALHDAGVSAEFWDDDDGQVAREADADMQTCLDALVAALTARWGEPLAVDLLLYLRAGVEGETVSEPINSLSQMAGSIELWPHQSSGRRLGLAIGQEDKELPLELLAAVGDRSGPNGT
ncbi:hypothetical protein [Streptomyces sp. NPDC051286]|uniref:hypothetical protein n=1 Tax=Streptomyces sp. NPDC051286 TaxID=3365647 RepID=UPI0037A9095D